MLDSLKRVGIGVLKHSRYPSIVRAALSRSPLPINISAGADVDIHAGCKLVGDIDLADSVTVGPGCELRGEVRVGRGTNLVDKNELIGDVSIGRYCAVGRRTVLHQQDHFMHRPSIQMEFNSQMIGDALPFVGKGPIKFGSDVWTGLDSVVLSGVSVGHGAVVGANSVVTDDVEPYAIVAGSPAEHVGWRFDADLREQLLDIAWWEWSPSRIKHNREFFRTDLRTVDDVNALIS